MGGGVKKVDTRTGNQAKLQGGITDFIQGQGYGATQAAMPTDLPSFVGVQKVGPGSSLATDSVDKLGGANSAFFNNMVNQLQPSFNQARAEGVAAAKEGAGSLTGSGFANILGSAINRSMGSQQATLANYAAQGLNTEVGRQQGDANRAASMFESAQGANNLQAQLEAQRQALIFGTAANTNQGNASLFSNLLMSQAGNPSTAIALQKKGGIGSILAPIASGIGMAIGGPIGGAIGGKVGGMFGGGGGGAIPDSAFGL